MCSRCTVYCTRVDKTSEISDIRCVGSDFRTLMAYGYTQRHGMYLHTSLAQSSSYNVEETIQVMNNSNISPSVADLGVGMIPIQRHLELPMMWMVSILVRIMKGQAPSHTLNVYLFFLLFLYRRWVVFINSIHYFNATGHFCYKILNIDVASELNGQCIYPPHLTWNLIPMNTNQK